MSNLHALHAAGVSVWSDQISRSMLQTGELARRVRHDTVSGVTSNPTIFASAITKSTDYDDLLGEMAKRDASTDEIYAALITRDIQQAADVLQKVFVETEGRDGFVSVEVSPELAADTEATLAEAREWVKRIDRPNLLVKIPATAEGLPAIRGALAEGISINVTLIFSLHRYREVMAAWLDGLEGFAATGGDLRTVASVASFFVSRVDTEVDQRLEAIGGERALSLRGQAAVANARVAYGLFGDILGGSRGKALTARGARFQRPLWASTSTKNPTYRDTLYVDTLVAPDTVNTMPLETIDAYQDHGPSKPAPFGDEDIDAARQTLADLERVGVPYAEVVAVLEREGVEKFVKSFRELWADLDRKRQVMAGA